MITLSMKIRGCWIPVRSSRVGALTGIAMRRAALVLLALAPLAAPASEDPAGLSDLKRMSVEELMNLEVTSVTRRPERLADAPAAVQVITREQLRRSGATTLAEALRLAHNLQVAQRDGHNWGVTARGFNTELVNKMLVLIDGRSVYTPLFSGVFWDAQGYLLEDVERIEVISGPGGTQWGANAVNGVISVITRSAAQTQGLFATAAAGPQQRVVGARYGTAISPDWHLRVFGKHVDQDENLRSDGAPAGDDWRRVQGGFRLDGVARGGALTVQGDAYQNEENDPEVANGQTRLTGANLLSRWSRELADDGHLSLQAYVDWTRYEDDVPPLVVGDAQVAPGGEFQDDLITFDLDLQHRFRPHAAHTLTWGVGLRHMRDDVENAAAIAVLPARLDQTLYSLFLQDEIRLREGLLLTLGSKFEHHDYTGLEVQPSARLQWRVNPSHMAWASVSRAVRIPSRLDRDVFQAAPPGFPLLYGNPDFRSEKLIAWEAGHRGSFGRRVSTSLALFLNEYDDVRTITITPQDLLPFRMANDLQGRTWGLELSGTAEISDRWSLRAGYNFLDDDLHVRPGAIDISNGRNETADPEQQVMLGTSVSLPWRLELDANLRWVDRLHISDGPETGIVPDYIEMDARLAWLAGDHLELALVGRNLLHARHVEYGFPGPGRTQIKRSVYGRVTWRH